MCHGAVALEFVSLEATIDPFTVFWKNYENLCLAVPNKDLYGR